VVYEGGYAHQLKMTESDPGELGEDPLVRGKAHELSTKLPRPRDWPL